MSIRNQIAYVEPGTEIEATWDATTRDLKLRQGFRAIGNLPTDRPSDAVLALEYLDFVDVRGVEMLDGSYSFTATKVER